MTPAISEHDARAWRRALIVVTAAALVRCVFASLIPLFPDETYYWDWSRQLAAGYFDHPGGVAWLVRAGSALLAPFGLVTSPLLVRLGPVVAGFVAALATVGLARRTAGDGAALRAAMLITVLPLAAAGLIITTPDSPVLAATAVGLYCVVRALEHAPHTRRSFEWWCATGVALGLAFASKYTSIFLPIAVVVAIVARPDLRARLREPGPYFACVIATLIFLPVLLWNARHDWISFVYQLRHGLAAPQGSALLAAWKHEGDFFGGQAGLASPIVFVLLIIVVVRALRRSVPPAEFVLGAVAALSFTFFIYSALRQRVEPNWPAPAYIPAIALLAGAEWGHRGERWYRAGLILAGLLSLVIYVQALVPVLPLAPRKDPIARAFGWNEVVHRADLLAQSATAATGSMTWLAGDRYQEASELAFLTPTHPPTFALNLAGRPNQYDLWPRFSERARVGDNLVLVLDDDAEPHAAIRALTPYFGTVEKRELVVLRRGAGEIGTRRLWLLSRWTGGWPTR